MDFVTKLILLALASLLIIFLAPFLGMITPILALILLVLWILLLWG